MPQYVYDDQQIVFVNGPRYGVGRGGRGGGFRGNFRGGRFFNPTIIAVPSIGQSGNRGRERNGGSFSDNENMGNIRPRSRSRSRSDNRQTPVRKARPPSRASSQGPKEDNVPVKANGANATGSSNGGKQHSKGIGSGDKNIGRIEADVRKEGRDVKRVNVRLTDLTTGGPTSISARIDFPTICQGISDKRYTFQIIGEEGNTDFEGWLSGLNAPKVEYTAIKYTGCGNAGGQRYLLYGGRSVEPPSANGSIDLGLATRAITSGANGESVVIDDTTGIVPSRFSIDGGSKQTFGGKKSYGGNIAIRRTLSVIDGKMFNKEGSFWKPIDADKDSMFACHWFYFERRGFPDGTSEKIIEEFALSKETYLNTKQNAKSGSATTLGVDERKTFENVNSKLAKKSLILRDVELLISYNKEVTTVVKEMPGAYVKI